MENILLKLKEAWDIIWNTIKNGFKNIWSNIKKSLFKIYSKDIEFKKFLSIYNRTKKKRIRKKYYNKMIRFIIKHPIRV